MFNIEVERTTRLHRSLAELAAQHQGEFLAALQTANAAMVERGIDMGPNRPLDVALSALQYSEADVRQVSELAGGLHAIVEQVLGHVTADPDLLARSFPDHQRVFPYLAKTAGSDSWQMISRYDVG